MDHIWSDLIERAKADEQEAFFALYQSSYDAVYRTVKSMVRDDDAAADIVQDAFVKGFESLSSLDDPDSFLPWMKRIAVNKAKDYFKRKHEVAISQLSGDGEYVPDIEDERPDHMPEEVIDRDETARLIEEILRTLSDEQRMVIGMFYYEDMAVAEIARELEISENTVKSRLNYGRKKIRASVEELEKKGTKLYSLAPVPFLVWLFKSQILNPSTWNAPAEAFGSIMANTALHGTAAAASGTAASVTAAQGSGGAAAASSSAGAGAAASGSAQAGAAAVQGSVAAGKAGGLLSTVGAKITAGVLTAAIVGGGAGAGLYFSNRDKNDGTPAVSETEQYEAVQTTAMSSPPSEEPEEEIDAKEEIDADHEKELLTLFLEEELIRNKGVYDTFQPYFTIGANGEIRRTNHKYYPDEDKWMKSSGEYRPGDREYDAVLAEFEASKENTGISGMIERKINFWDGDEKPELLTVYGEDGTVYLEMFKVENGEVVSIGKLSFRELGLAYNRQIIGCYLTATGNGNIVIFENMYDAYPPHGSTYYLISSDLRPISYVIIDENGGTGTEYFYNGAASRTFEVENAQSYKDVLDSLGDYGGYAQTICEFFDSGTESSSLIQKYYGKDIEQIRAERESASS